jgi:hypothetical protein
MIFTKKWQEKIIFSALNTSFYPGHKIKNGLKYDL